MTEYNTIQQFSSGDYIIKARDNIYSGFFRIDQYQLKHRQFDGSWSDDFQRDVFERGDAVILMPYDPVADKVILIEQFRIGAIRSNSDPWQLEFVGGMFGKDESRTDVAIREAKEEADIDIEPKNLVHMMDFLTSPGGTSEKLFLYMALFDSTKVADGTIAGLEEENEDILVHLLPREDALTLLSTGRIGNASTIIGLQWLAMNYQKYRPVNALSEK